MDNITVRHCLRHLSLPNPDGMMHSYYAYLLGWMSEEEYLAKKRDSLKPHLAKVSEIYKSSKNLKFGK